MRRSLYPTSADIERMLADVLTPGTLRSYVRAFEEYRDHAERYYLDWRDPGSLRSYAGQLDVWVHHGVYARSTTRSRLSGARRITQELNAYVDRTRAHEDSRD